MHISCGVATGYGEHGLRPKEPDNYYFVVPCEKTSIRGAKGDNNSQSNMSPQHGNLFLIGYRCTGKSAVAALIAEGLGWSAVDADAVLENECGRSIREIFAEDGEPAFRDRESDVLAAICSQQRQVVATGGGVILRQENRRLLKESGKTVWLTAEPATIWRRMQGDATTTDRRPNLTVGGLAEIEQLLAERMPLYEQCAHWKVATDANSPEDVAREILQLMINDDQIEQG